jgi:hypothetical protein
MVISMGKRKVNINLNLGKTSEIVYLDPMQSTTVRAQYIHTAQSLVHCLLLRRRSGLASPKNAWGWNGCLIYGLIDRILILSKRSVIIFRRLSRSKNRNGGSSSRKCWGGKIFSPFLINRVEATKLRVDAIVSWFLAGFTKESLFGGRHGVRKEGGTGILGIRGIRGIEEGIERGR